jgi:anti-sigma factor RsiW
MICQKFQDQLPMYWDLHREDAMKLEMDNHMQSCETCKSDFAFWQESNQLIHDIPMVEEVAKTSRLASSVMDRIYSEEKWRAPIHTRSFGFSLAARRNISLAVAFFMALFVISFVASLMHKPAIDTQEYASAQSPATAVSVAIDSTNVASEDNAVLLASVTEPPMIQIKSINDSPNYYVAISLFGMTVALLTLNWLNRVKN